MTSGFNHIHLPYFNLKKRKQHSFLTEIEGRSLHFKKASDGLTFLAKSFFEKNNRPAQLCIPDFICNEVSDALKVADAKVVFYKIKNNLEIDLLDLRAKITENDFDFILVVNYFGHPADIKSIKEVIGSKNIKIIEDNAHGLLSKDQEDKWLGLRGDFGLFSPRKTFPIPFGGFLFSSQQHFNAVPGYNILTLSFGDKLNYYLKLLFKYSMASLFIKKHTASIRKKNLNLINSEESSIELFNWISWAQIWDFNQEIVRRRQLHFKMKKLVEKVNLKSIYQEIGEGEVPYGFVFFNNDAQKLMEIKLLLKNYDIEFFSWPSLPKEVVVPSDHHYKNIYVVRYLW